MAEGLSQDQEWEAGFNADRTRRLSEKAEETDHAFRQALEDEKRLLDTANSIGDPEIAKKLHESYSELRHKTDDNERAKAGQAASDRDASFWQAHQHKEQHLDQYIETARQEAEADGVHIDLEGQVPTEKTSDQTE